MKSVIDKTMKSAVYKSVKSVVDNPMKYVKLDCCTRCVAMLQKIKSVY